MYMERPSDVLPEELLERVLLRLGFNKQPAPDFAGLSQLYTRWGQSIPFDNVRKMIHMRGGKSEPLPGTTAVDFFEAWLRHGTGGTCWSNAGACAVLLKSLGFQAVRGVGTMLVVPDLPPNHGTVQVTLDGVRYLVDCSMLYGEPLRLEEGKETGVPHPAWGVTCAQRDGRWHIAWRPLHKTDGFECRLERFDATHDEYADLFDQTRGWSPFNYELSVRLNKADKVVGAAFGHAISLSNDGRVARKPIDDTERRQLLIEEIGMSEEIVSQLPPDVTTPPPPGSKTAIRTGTIAS